MTDFCKTWRPIRLACAFALLAAPALAATPAPAQHFLTLPKSGPKSGQAHGPASGAASASLGNVRAAPKPVVNGAPPVGAIHPAGLHASTQKAAQSRPDHSRPDHSRPDHSRPYVSSKRTISSSPR